MSSFFWFCLAGILISRVLRGFSFFFFFPCLIVDLDDFPICKNHAGNIDHGTLLHAHSLISSHVFATEFSPPDPACACNLFPFCLAELLWDNAFPILVLDIDIMTPQWFPSSSLPLLSYSVFPLLPPVVNQLRWPVLVPTTHRVDRPGPCESSKSLHHPDLHL